MQRILIIGSSGAGKSTLSRQLATITGLPLIHIDQLFWLPGWVERDRPTFRKMVAAVVAEDSGIMDGNYGSTYDLRIPRADTIIWLDLSRWVCLWGAFKRIVGLYGKVRSDMTEGCPEPFNREFFHYILTFPEKHRPRIVKGLQTYAEGKNIIQLRTRKEVRDFLKQYTLPNHEIRKTKRY